MNRVTDLKIGESLTISNRSGSQVIVWMKKPDASSIFKFRRMHFRGNKLLRVMDNHKLGGADNEELVYRVSEEGWKII